MKAIEKFPSGVEQRPVCFVIMPIADSYGYETGHFARVYEHLLKPAIKDAGYEAIRSDDTSKTDYIVVGIIRRIIESEMVLCDFSAKNPNVMYELGLRHAFNKPVTLVKDRGTDKVFDIQGLRYVEYDHSLRVDTVQKDIDKIAIALKETAAASPSDINSVMQLAGLKAAEQPVGTTISSETQLILSAIDLLRNRVNSAEDVKKPLRFFTIAGDDEIILEGNEPVGLGETIFDGSGNALGSLIDIHPGEEKIFLKAENGKITPYSALSVKSKNLTTMPF